MQHRAKNEHPGNIFVIAASREHGDKVSIARCAPIKRARSVCVAPRAKEAAQLNAILARRRVNSCMWRYQALQLCAAQG